MNDVEKTYLWLTKSIDGEISGWASAPDEERNPTVTVLCAEVPLGERRRIYHNRHADKTAGRPGSRKGFRVPLTPALAYMRLVDRAHPAPVGVSFAGKSLSGSRIPLELRSVQGFQPLALASDTLFRLTDLFFAGGDTLRLRFEGRAPDQLAPYVVRFYQPDLPGKRPLVQIGEQHLTPAALVFADVALSNPFAPVLISLTDAEGILHAVDCLPFPSLARRGAHHAELRALGLTGRFLPDLCALSSALAQDAFRAPSDNAASPIADIVFSAGEARSAEALPFFGSLTDFLRALPGKAIGFGDMSIDSTATASVAAGDAPAEPIAATNAAPPGLRLTLGPGSYPTLSALLTNRVAPYGAQRTAPPFLVAGRGTGDEAWLIRRPAGHGWPGEADAEGRGVPILSCDGAAASNGAGSPALPRFPVAIKWSGAAYPADDRAARRRRPAPDAERVKVSVLVILDGSLGGLVPLLDSLKAQSIGKPHEIFLVGAAGEGFAGEAETLIKKYAGGRGRWLEATDRASRDRRVNEAAAAAACDYLLLVSPDVVLPEAGTLATLVKLAADERVASASCLIHRLDGQGAVESRTGGLFPTAISLFDGGNLRYAAIDTVPLLGFDTYPVAANGLDLCLFRRAAWQALGGLPTSRFPIGYADLELGLRAVGQGLYNLCTTTVSADASGGDDAAMEKAAGAASPLAPIGLDAVIAGCTIVQTLPS